MNEIVRSARSLPVAFWLLLACGAAAAAYALTFTHFAGAPGGPGYDDGVGAAARFSFAAGVAVDHRGYVYVSDQANCTIRVVAPTGEVTTLAGRAGSGGSIDGRGGDAYFNSPAGITIDGDGNVIVADRANHSIRMVTPARIVSTLAGTGAIGSADGAAASATFFNPADVAVDAAGNIYVADSANNVIRKITPAGVVSTLAGSAGLDGTADGIGSAARFWSPQGLTVLGGALYVADTYNERIRVIDLASAAVSTLAGSTYGHSDATGTSAQFARPTGIETDGTDLIVVDSGSSAIRRVTTAGVVSTIAGLPFYPGPQDGVGLGARFRSPAAVAVGPDGAIWIADTSNHTLRKVVGISVTTFAGVAPASGLADGVGAAARFTNPSGIGSYPGYLAVADTGNHAIRAIVMSSGEVSTLAGNGSAGTADGTGSAARFNSPKGVAIRGSDSTVFVADTGNHTIRHVVSGTVTTVAGLAGNGGSTDALGGAARFLAPEGIAVLGSTVYVADTGNHTIRQIDHLGNVTTLAGLAGSPGSVDGTGSAARFARPSSISIDALGDLYVTDREGYTVRKVTQAGAVTTVAGGYGLSAVDGTGTAARFGYPGPAGISMFGSIGYVADPNAHLVRTINTAGVVGTAGGANLVAGSWSGTGSFAAFNGPQGVVHDYQRFGGTVPPGAFVSDTGNHAIRYGGDELDDRAVYDVYSAPAGTMRQLDAVPNTASSWKWTMVRRPAGSTATLSSTTVRNPTFTPDLADVYVFRIEASDGVSSSISIVTLAATPPVGCTYAIAPGSASVPAAGGNGSVTITAPSGCEWSATSSEEWLQITSPPSGSSNGTVEWSAEANSGSSRSAVITVGGEAFTVTQSGSALDDFDGDGRSDLIWRQPSTGRNVLWAMNGAARLGYTSLLGVPGTDWSMVGTGDFNSDAKPDLLWRNSSTGQNIVWFMDGATRTSYASMVTVPTAWSVGGVGDFDADGDADIVWRNPATGQNVLWFMTGIVRDSYDSMLTVTGTEWKIAGAGDFDKDGDADLIWRNGTTGQNVIWAMNGASRTSYASAMTVADPAWRIQAVADYDGDGDADLFWRNVVSGQNVIWFMEGATRSSYASALTVSDLSWEVQSPR